MIALAQEHFAKTRFRDPRAAAEHMVTVVSRSSMVSMFEKPKFRDWVKARSDTELSLLTNGLKHMLHGNQQRGLTSMVGALAPGKLAKWSLVSIIPNYYHPHDDVFVKPTTAKGIIDYFELEGLEYRPTPTWEFYEAYRAAILAMKAEVDVSVAPNNAAFCGFLMMSMEE